MNYPEAYKALLKLNPEAYCTYFPMEQRYQAHIWGRPLSKFHRHPVDAILEGIETLKKEQENES
jgi:hypothetical protein